MTQSPSSTSLLSKFSELITGWRFAAFVIALCMGSFIFLATALLIPESAGKIGAIATEFKTWCFGYDPATGEYRLGYIPVMLLNPLLLSGVVYLIWNDALREAVDCQLWPLVRTASVGTLCAALLGGGLFLFGPEKTIPPPLPFPGERIRTQIEPPQFALTDQNGDALRLEDLRGRVVLLTAVYTRCATACPMIMVEARRAMAALPEHLRDEISIVAITLDPEYDSPKHLREAMKIHRLEEPLWSLVTGSSDEVNTVLDQLSVSRSRNAETDDIGHSNLFALIDRQGKIAYRLTLSNRHGSWLESALRALAEEGLQGSLTQKDPSQGNPVDDHAITFKPAQF